MHTATDTFLDAVELVALGVADGVALVDEDVAEDDFFGVDDDFFVELLLPLDFFVADAVRSACLLTVVLG